MSNIYGLPASESFTVEQALNSALNMAGDLTDVLILGYDSNGALVVRSSRMDRKEALWIIKQAELHALDR